MTVYATKRLFYYIFICISNDTCGINQPTIITTTDSFELPREAYRTFDPVNAVINRILIPIVPRILAIQT